MLEYWICWKDICFYMDGTNQKIKTDCYPLLIPDIPFFNYSMGYQTAKTTPLE